MNLRKIGKTILFTIGTFICFILLYISCAYVLSRIEIAEEPISKNDVEIFIVTNGVHTDLVVPVKNDQMDWSKEIKYSNTKSADTTAHYLAMGWGDKGFYLETPTWADLKARVAFKAAFALGNTAIHATFYKNITIDESSRKINISKEQYARLVEYIINSFKKDQNGHFININTNANYGSNDAFYEANGSYSMIHTCNSWANNGLKSCGQKACLWTPFDTGIFLLYTNSK